MSIYETLREHIFGLEIMDTHEHLSAWEKDRGKGDVLAEYLGHYFRCDLISAGLPEEKMAYVGDSSKPLMERWRFAEPYWQAARNTGYGRALDIAARDLHGVPRIARDTIEALDKSFQAARAAGKVYETVLKEKSKIAVSILDSGILDCDRRYFAPTVRMDDFIGVADANGLNGLAKRAGAAAIHSLGDLEDACEAALDKAFAQGAVCIKSGLAYCRTLDYPKVSQSAAQDAFAGLFSRAGKAMGGESTAALQNHMMHHVCRLADRKDLAMQIHTGLQEGNANYIDNSDPALLANLFMEYRNARFDVFHIGYPFQLKLSALAKNFANVFVDFCWANIISPAAAIDAFVEFLDAVPANKISGFGGDYCFIDGVYGHQYIARENVARALTIRVGQGASDIDEAKELAKMILHDNPARIFGLRKAGQASGLSGKRHSKKGE